MFFITKLLGKLFEKTPLNSSAMLNSVVLNPLNIINKSAETNRQKMKYLLHYLMDLKIVSPGFDLRTHDSYFKTLVDVFTNHILAENTDIMNRTE